MPDSDAVKPYIEDDDEEENFERLDFDRSKSVDHTCKFILLMIGLLFGWNAYCPSLYLAFSEVGDKPVADESIQGMVFLFAKLFAICLHSRFISELMQDDVAITEASNQEGLLVTDGQSGQSGKPDSSSVDAQARSMQWFDKVTLELCKVGSGESRTTDYQARVFRSLLQAAIVFLIGYFLLMATDDALLCLIGASMFPIIMTRQMAAQYMLNPHVPQYAKRMSIFDVGTLVASVWMLLPKVITSLLGWPAFTMVGLAFVLLVFLSIRFFPADGFYGPARNLLLSGEDVEVEVEPGEDEDEKHARGSVPSLSPVIELSGASAPAPDPTRMSKPEISAGLPPPLGGPARPSEFPAILSVDRRSVFSRGCRVSTSSGKPRGSMLSSGRCIRASLESQLAHSAEAPINLSTYHQESIQAGLFLSTKAEHNDRMSQCLVSQMSANVSSKPDPPRASQESQQSDAVAATPGGRMHPPKKKNTKNGDLVKFAKDPDDPTDGGFAEFGHYCKMVGVPLPGCSPFRLMAIELVFAYLNSTFFGNVVLPRVLNELENMGWDLIGIILMIEGAAMTLFYAGFWWNYRAFEIVVFGLLLWVCSPIAVVGVYDFMIIPACGTDSIVGKVWLVSAVLWFDAITAAWNKAFAAMMPFVLDPSLQGVFVLGTGCAGPILQTLNYLQFVLFSFTNMGEIARKPGQPSTNDPADFRSWFPTTLIWQGGQLVVLIIVYFAHRKDLKLRFDIQRMQFRCHLSGDS